MQPYDKQRPNPSMSDASRSPAKRRERIVRPLTNHERLREQMRRERDRTRPVIPRELPPAPEDSRELREHVQCLIRHALGGPLPVDVAPAVLDDKRRSLVLQRTSMALTALGIAGEELDWAYERLAVIQETAAIALGTDNVD